MTETAVANPNESIRRTIMSQVADATQAGIEEEIENKKKDVREGKSGFFQKIILLIAEFLDNLFGGGNGITNWLAKISGNPVPSNEEIKTASEMTGKAVSTALTDSNFTYKNKKEFVAGLKSRIFDEMNTNRDALPNFNDERIDELATKAANTLANEKFSGLFMANGDAKENPFNLSAVEMVAAGKIKEQFEKGLKGNPKEAEQLAQLMGKTSIGAAELDILSTVLAKPMADIEGNKEAIKSQGDKAYAIVAEKIRTKLGSLKDAGIDIGEAGIAAMADTLAIRYVQDPQGLGIKEPPSKEFIIASEGRKQAAINEIIQEKTWAMASQKMVTEAAKGVRAAYEDSTVTGIAYPKGALAVFDKYYTKTNKGLKGEDYIRNNVPEVNGELAKAEKRLFEFAGNRVVLPVIGSELKGVQMVNEAQRDAISVIVAEAAREVLNSADSKDKLPEKLQEAVATALANNQEKIDKLGTSIAAINTNNTDKNGKVGDMFGDIANGIADAANKEEVKKLLVAAQEQLEGSRRAVVIATQDIQRGSPNTKGGSDVNRDTNLAADNAARQGRVNEPTTVVAAR